MSYNLLLGVTVEGVEQAGDGAVTLGLLGVDALPGPPERHRLVQDPGLVSRAPLGQAVALPPPALGPQHDAVVEVAVLPQAPATATGQVGLNQCCNKLFELFEW